MAPASHRRADAVFAGYAADWRRYLLVTSGMEGIAALSIYPLGGRGLQLACHVTESGTEIGADQGERGNSCHRDQGGNQRVLDRRYTRFILE